MARLRDVSALFADAWRAAGVCASPFGVPRVARVRFSPANKIGGRGCALLEVNLRPQAGALEPARARRRSRVAI